nr:TOBE domain-containing protein [Micromonospora sp. DSM 115978]
MHAVAPGVDALVSAHDSASGSGLGDGFRRDVVLGVRPEHLTAVPPESSPATALRGTVRAVENLGSELIAHCVVG